MNVKQEKLKKEIQKLASQFISEQSTRISMITVTRVDLTGDHKKATLYISVLPNNKEGEALEFMNRHRYDLREFLKKYLKTRIIPEITNELDENEKKRQRIEDLTEHSRSNETD